MGWVNFDFKALDWPVVQFVVSHRALAVRRNLGEGPDLLREDPQHVEQAFNDVIARVWPEYAGAALLSYGNETPSIRVFFNAAHARFPRTSESLACKGPQWRLFDRCSRPQCNGPIVENGPDFGLGYVLHLEPTPGDHPRLYFERVRCAACVKAGHVPDPDPKPNPTLPEVAAARGEPWFFTMKNEWSLAEPRKIEWDDTADEPIIRVGRKEGE
jgi:hypothetical protein